MATTSTGIDIEIASNCPRCAAGHTNHCTCVKNCGHPNCHKSR